MPRVGFEIKPETFEPVHLRSDFDLQTFLDLGLDISRLVDPSKDGLMYRLRYAAARLVANTPTDGSISLDDNYYVLHEANGAVNTEMDRASRNYRKDISLLTVIDHPAIQSYAERNPICLENASKGNYKTTRSHLEDNLWGLNKPGLVLLRPTDEGSSANEDPLHGYEIIEDPHHTGRGIRSPAVVARQLMRARLGLVGYLDDFRDLRRY